MNTSIIQYIVFFIMGLIVYLKSPRYFFIYWLSIPPILTPIFFMLFPISDKEEFWLMYAKGIAPVSYLCLFLIIKEMLSNNSRISKCKIIFSSFFLLSFFLITQNVFLHFHLPTLLKTLISHGHMVFPLILLIILPKVRPTAKTLISFSFFIILLESFFCVLNLWGYKVYPTALEDYNYESHLVSGTFARFNHLTNYLTTIYLFLSIEFYVFKTFSRRMYLFLTVLIGIIVVGSGSRLSTILFLFIMFSTFIVNYGFKFVYIIPIGAIIVCGFLFLFSSKTASLSEQNEGTGLERVVLGLSSFLQSEGGEDESTFALSVYLLQSHFNNPFIGNGYTYLGEKGYDRGDFANQRVFMADARFVYTIVEYGIVGCLAFLYFFNGLFKSIAIYGEKLDKKYLWIIVLYFVLNTITDQGLFDTGLLSMAYIFSFKFRKGDCAVPILRT